MYRGENVVSFLFKDVKIKYYVPGNMLQELYMIISNNLMTIF